MDRWRVLAMRFNDLHRQPEKVTLYHYLVMSLLLISFSSPLDI